MPEEEKKRRSRSSGRLSTVNEHAAGLDVYRTRLFGHTFVQAAIA
jgi:hypothetical protein